MSHSHTPDCHKTIDTIDELKDEAQVLKDLIIRLEADCIDSSPTEKAVMISVIHMIGNLRKVYLEQ